MKTLVDKNYFLSAEYLIKNTYREEELEGLV